MGLPGLPGLRAPPPGFRLLYTSTKFRGTAARARCDLLSQPNLTPLPLSASSAARCRPRCFWRMKSVNNQPRMGESSFHRPPPPLLPVTHLQQAVRHHLAVRMNLQFHDFAYSRRSLQWHTQYTTVKGVRFTTPTEFFTERGSF